MKFCIAILIPLAVFLSPSVNGSESDVVRVFDEKLRLTEEEMIALLKKADLEKYGFTRTDESSTETDEDGNVSRKRTIYYKVTDDCDKVMFWEGVLEQRLPKKLKNLNLSSTTVKEVQSRINGRKTKSCTVGLEIHPNRCAKESSSNDVSKRGAGKGCWMCRFCWEAAIVYDE